MFKLIQQEESNEYLSFLIDGEHFCLNISLIQEIIYVPPISKIPNVSLHVEGAIDLRGKIIRVINLRKWLGLAWQHYTAKSRILIINLKDGIFGLLVDEVLEVFKTEKSMIHEPPQILQQEAEIAYMKSIILNNNLIFLELNPGLIRV